MVNTYNMNKHITYVLLAGLFTALMVSLFIVNPIGVNAQTSTTETETENESDDGNHNGGDHEVDDSDNDNVDDEMEKENERSIEISASDDQLEIKSERQNAAAQDEMKIKVKTETSDGDDEGDENEGLKIKVAYSSETETETTETGYEIEFKISFYSLIEYIDNDGNGIYNADNDTQVQNYVLTNFLPITYTNTTAETGENIYQIEVETADHVFLTRIYVSSQFAIVNGTNIAPTEVKIDVEIRNFPYLNDSSALALKIKMQAESEYSMEEETEDEAQGRAKNETGVEISQNGKVGFFSWVEHAMVDGVQQPVKSSNIADDEQDPTEKNLYLCYTRGTEIIHDPKVGMENVLIDPNASSPAIPGYIGFLPIFIVGFAIAVLLTNKRRIRQN